MLFLEDAGLEPRSIKDLGHGLLLQQILLVS